MLWFLLFMQSMWYLITHGQICTPFQLTFHVSTIAFELAIISPNLNTRGRHKQSHLVARMTFALFTSVRVFFLQYWKACNRSLSNILIVRHGNMPGARETKFVTLLILFSMIIYLQYIIGYFSDIQNYGKFNSISKNSLSAHQL